MTTSATVTGFATCVGELRIDVVLAAITETAIAKAIADSAAVASGPRAGQPTSLRLSRRTLRFYEALAAELGVSRNAVMQMLLEHLVSTARRSA